MNLNSLLSDLHLTWTLELFPSAHKALGVFCYTCTDFACQLCQIYPEAIDWFIKHEFK